ncbi:MAG: GerMN domain-containing protein [Synergistaceae bacterium]|jgi:hypothetical protein|nr:GerMN domain-containing protein [Synergistaceae bacterium]
MKPTARRKWKSSDEPSPRERREMINRGEWEDETEVPKKAPFPFRLAAWASLVVLFFAIGYGVTSMLFNWMDREHPEAASPPNLISTPEQAERLAVGIRSSDEAASRPAFETLTLSIPEGSAFVTRQIRCDASLREDVMLQTLSAYMDAVKESKMLDPVANSLNLFQSGEWLYLNVNRSFFESIKALGQEKATALLTGLVRTISMNFEPITKVKFYVDGKEVKDKKPVDMTVPWGVKGS